jgi:isoleucyl-tRNA synthetase
MSRTTDVGNPWLDAGIVSFSTLIDPKTGKVSYLDNQEYWKQWFPADFVTECFPGQFRNWFYSLIAMATGLEDKNPFKTLLGHSLAKDEKGEEMHKSKGNAIWFEDAALKMGVDTMRWLYTRQDPENNLNLGYKLADEVRRQYIFLYWNSYRFFTTYANLNNWQSGKINFKDSQFPLDQWILSRLESTKEAVEKNLDKYLHHKAIGEIEKFLEDLSLIYIRGSRERLSPANENEEERNFGLAVLYHTLEQLSLVLAPFIPFLTETVWQSLKGTDLSVENSIHLQDWPEKDNGLINRDLEKTMQLAREVISVAHSQREEAEIKVRQPLSSLATASASKITSAKLDDYVKNEVNVKNLTQDKETKLDTTITDELREEGEANELMRNIQMTRREAGLSPEDMVVVTAPDWSKKFEEEILRRTRATKIVKGDKLSVEKV